MFKTDCLNVEGNFVIFLVFLHLTSTIQLPTAERSKKANELACYKNNAFINSTNLGL